MAEKIKTSLYIDQRLYEEMKDYFEENKNEFKTMSAFIEYLFKIYKENDFLIRDSNLESIRRDISKIKKYQEINLQLNSSIAENNQVFIGDYYEENPQYKTVKQVVENKIKSNQMQEHVKKIEENIIDIPDIKSKNTFSFDEY